MNARMYAWNVLDRVMNHGAYASLVMREKNDLSPLDQGLASEIIYGSLRSWMWLQYQWQDLAAKTKPKTAVLLSMSVYQLLKMERVPAYAVINDAVAMANPYEKKFVNAVLRQVQRRGERLVDETDELKKAAIETSHPLWILKLWEAHYGKSTALSIAQADQQPAAVYGRWNTLHEGWQTAAADPKVKAIEDDCFQYDGILASSPLFQKGFCVIQDRTSQRVVRMLDARSGMEVLDACAAPGTKTQQIACAMNNQGRITAFDLYPGRVQLINALMKQTGVNIVEASVHDASVAADGMYDRILLDVPCSGLGDLAHKPEIRYHLKPENLDQLIDVQQKILNAQALRLKEGGRFVYSTCTLDQKENAAQIRCFLQEHPQFSLCEEHTWFPQDLHGSGFYGALVERVHF